MLVKTPIYSSVELKKTATVRKFRIVQDEGGREVTRNIEQYNLDMIISVGYRVNSKTATKFRQWATSVLHGHIKDGYTLNRVRLGQNYDKFVAALEQIESVSGVDSLSSSDVLGLVKMFAGTWVSLDAFDRGELPHDGFSSEILTIEYEELAESIQELKTDLLSQGLATDIFAQERDEGGLKGILGNVFQSFGGEEVYGSVEEKAAHMLYFVIKNHPFVDGNKRTGAYCFVWLLKKAGALDVSKISPQALTAITLLIAQSDPAEKDKIVGLVLLLLK